MYFKVLAKITFPLIIKDLKSQRMTGIYIVNNEDELIEFITKTISEKPGLNTNAVMGLVMKEYRGKYSGQKILEMIKKCKGE